MTCESRDTAPWWKRLRINDILLSLESDLDGEHLEFGAHFVVGKHAIVSAKGNYRCLVLRWIDETVKTKNIEIEVGSWGLSEDDFDAVQLAPPRVKQWLVRQIRKSKVMPESS